MPTIRSVLSGRLLDRFHGALGGRRESREHQPFNHEDQAKRDDEIGHEIPSGLTADPFLAAILRRVSPARRRGHFPRAGCPRIDEEAEEFRIRLQQHAGIVVLERVS